MSALVNSTPLAKTTLSKAYDAGIGRIGPVQRDGLLQRDVCSSIASGCIPDGSEVLLAVFCIYLYGLQSPLGQRVLYECNSAMNYQRATRHQQRILQWLSCLIAMPSYIFFRPHIHGEPGTSTELIPNPT